MVPTTDAQVQAVPVEKIKKVKKVKKITFTIKKTKKSKKSKKEVDPLKVNAMQALQRIAFTKVEDRFLMNAEDINKDDSLRCFIGFDNPTTCQLNLNYLYCKAIACMDKRMSSIEKQVKIISGESEPASLKQVCGNKRKRGADNHCQTVFRDGGDKSTQVCHQDDEKEPGEITLDDGATA